MTMEGGEAVVGLSYTQSGPGCSGSGVSKFTQDDDWL